MHLSFLCRETRTEGSGSTQFFILLFNRKFCTYRNYSTQNVSGGCRIPEEKVGKWEKTGQKSGILKVRVEE